MPQLVKKRRSGWAVLAVCALVASILAVGAGSIAAQPAATDAAADPDNNPEWGASWSACVGAAGSYDAMFSDVGDGVLEELRDAINCIGYYGITVGMGDGTYAPEANVSAFEMRLFVERAADHMGADGAAVLGGVMLSDPVTRLEMAQLMFGLVDDISDDVRISPLDGQIESYNYDTRGWDVVNDFFADVKFLEPIRESQIVGATYELGITKGRSADVSTADSVFAPSDPVSRAEMAAFIARTLDHSNLRPEGLAVQRNGNGDTMVSLRDADFAPVGDAHIDVFSALYPDDAFDPDDGECVMRFVRDETPSFSACAIDVGDQQTTDDLGNIEFQLVSDSDPIQVACGTGNFTFSTASGSEGRTFWAWTGDLGDEVNADTTLAELEDVARPVGTSGPDYARISGGLPTGDELAKMGETVTFTLQLHSEAGANGRDEGTLIDDPAAGTDRSRNAYLLRVEKHLVTRVAASIGTDFANDPTDYVPTDSDAETNFGTASADFADVPGDWNYGTSPDDGAGAAPSSAPADAAIAAAKAGSRIQTPVDTVVFPNSDGELLINLTHMDVNAASGMNDVDVGVRFTLRPFQPGNDFLDANLLPDIVETTSPGTNHVNVVDVPASQSTNPAAGTSVATGYVIFSDDASDEHSVKAESASYRIISGSGTGNSVTVTVLDQYGDSMRGVDVGVNSDLDGSGETDDVDQVVYPEQIDITVQDNEDGNGDGVADPTRTDASPTGAPTGVVASAIASTRSAAISATDGADSASTATRRQMVLAALRMNADGTLDVDVPADDVQGTLRTRGNGAYRIGYSYINSNEAQTETITPYSAQVVRLLVTATTTSDGAGTVTATSTVAMTSGVDGDDADDIVDTVTDVALATATAPEVGDDVMVYWAKIGTNGDSNDGVDGGENFVPIRVADVANRTIIANELDPGDTTNTTATTTDEPRAYFYDEDDVFIIEDAGATLAMFEEALSLTVRDDGCRADQVQWENYTFYSSRTPGAQPGRVGRTIWEITLS